MNANQTMMLGSAAVVEPSRRNPRIAAADASHTAALHLLFSFAPLLLCALLLTGCAFTDRRGDIITYTQSMVGISIGQNAATQSPEVKIGYIRWSASKIPTGKSGTNGIASPSLQNRIRVGVGTSTHIEEDLAVGSATKNLNDQPSR